MLKLEFFLPFHELSHKKELSEYLPVSDICQRVECGLRVVVWPSLLQYSTSVKAVINLLALKYHKLFLITWRLCTELGHNPVMPFGHPLERLAPASSSWHKLILSGVALLKLVRASMLAQQTLDTNMLYSTFMILRSWFSGAVPAHHHPWVVLWFGPLLTLCHSWLVNLLVNVIPKEFQCNS